MTDIYKVGGNYVIQTKNTISNLGVPIDDDMRYDIQLHKFVTKTKNKFIV